jgi:hypothetical protein
MGTIAQGVARIRNEPDGGTRAPIILSLVTVGRVRSRIEKAMLTLQAALGISQVVRLECDVNRVTFAKSGELAVL